ncbi:MAG: hypothetical protein ABRQ24_00785 [Syntrophomonadaceae bacterium]
MISSEMSPHLIFKIERVIDLNLQILGLLSEITEDIGDPALRNLIISVVGDKNGSVRFFMLLLLLMDGNNNLTENRRL